MTRNYHAETAASITALARRIMDTNLCKEIVFEGAYYAPYIPKFMTKQKYKFSRAKWYVADLFNKGYRMDEVREWCVEQFGPQDHNPDAWTRWTNSMNSTFRFRDQKDYNWFVLRWGA